MADIISGGSRFTGDKKAPVRKVIKLNTDSSIGTVSYTHLTLPTNREV